MRGLGLRRSAFALALSFGAAGAHSLGARSPTGVACSIDVAAAPSTTAADLAVAALPRAASGGGWTRTETERSGSSADAERACRARSTASAHPSLTSATGAGLSALPVRRSGGLLGLAASPANAPPGS